MALRAYTENRHSNSVSHTSDPTSANDSSQGYAVGSEWVNKTLGTVWFCVSAAVGAAVWKPSPATYQLNLGGRLDIPTLPLSGVGIELSDGAYVLTYFQARRGTAGTSGTTTIQLELNGAVVGGATLSWTGGTDANNALKNVAISQVIALGDRISFRLTAIEAGSPQDIYAQVW